MMAKGALMLNVKMILVTHNELHNKALMKILIDFIVADLKGNANYAMSKFAPSDVVARLDGLKPDRLVRFVKQKKRPADADAAGTPDTKRTELATNMESYLGGLDGVSPKPKAKAEPKSEIPAVPKVAQANAPSAPSPQDVAGAAAASSSCAAAAPVEDLASLLKSWSS
jgi:hypothetical protein